MNFQNNSVLIDILFCIRLEKNSADILVIIKTDGYNVSQGRNDGDSAGFYSPLQQGVQQNKRIDAATASWRHKSYLNKVSNFL